MSLILSFDLERNYQKIQSEIAPFRATLIAVSKKQSIEKLEALYRLGHRDFGENQVQSLVARAKHFSEKGITDIRWHFIGSLQRNKVKALLPWVDCIHSVDSLRLVEEIERRWSEELRGSSPLRVFVQVNIDHEEGKGGIGPDELPALLNAIKEKKAFQLLGLMCIPSKLKNEQGASFIKMKKLNNENKLSSLSMGMSSDYLLALQQGSTHIRVGTSLFGERET